MISKAKLESSIASVKQLSSLGKWEMYEQISCIGTIRIPRNDERISHLGAFDVSNYISLVGDTKYARYKNPLPSAFVFGSCVGFVG